MVWLIGTGVVACLWAASAVVGEPWPCSRPRAAAAEDVEAAPLLHGGRGGGAETQQ